MPGNKKRRVCNLSRVAAPQEDRQRYGIALVDKKKLPNESSREEIRKRERAGKTNTAIPDEERRAFALRESRPPEGESDTTRKGQNRMPSSKRARGEKRMRGGGGEGRKKKERPIVKPIKFLSRARGPPQDRGPPMYGTQNPIARGKGNNPPQNKTNIQVYPVQRKGGNPTFPTITNSLIRCLVPSKRFLDKGRPVPTTKKNGAPCRRRKNELLDGRHRDRKKKFRPERLSLGGPQKTKQIRTTSREKMRRCYSRPTRGGYLCEESFEARRNYHPIEAGDSYQTQGK